jgi:uncharacterized protein YbjT (DUF2867 family)
MYIVLTGGAGRMTKPLAMKLLEDGHAVIVVTRQAEHIAELTDPDVGAIAAEGSLDDVDFLTETFTDADAVYLMVPPRYDTESYGKWKEIGQTYATAIRRSGVKRVVQLSSVGAHLPEGAGPVSGLYYVEQELNTLEDVAVTHLRAAYLYYNLVDMIDLIKGMNVIGSVFGGDSARLPVVDATDVAEAAAEELTDSYAEGHKVRYVVSDEVTSGEMAAAVGQAIGKPDLQWKVFTPEEYKQGLVQAGMPEGGAASLTELEASIQKGSLLEHYREVDPPVTGKIKMQDYARQFADIYKAKS